MDKEYIISGIICVLFLLSIYQYINNEYELLGIIFIIISGISYYFIVKKTQICEKNKKQIEKQLINIKLENNNLKYIIAQNENKCQ